MLTPTISYNAADQTHADSYNILQHGRSNTCWLPQYFTIHQVKHMLTPTIFYNTAGQTHADYYNLLQYSRSNTCWLLQYVTTQYVKNADSYNILQYSKSNTCWLLQYFTIQQVKHMLAPGQTHVCDLLYCINPTVTAHHSSNSHKKSLSSYWVFHMSNIFCSQTKQIHIFHDVLLCCSYSSSQHFRGTQ
jgi:hypothetical protein